MKESIPPVSVADDDLSMRDSLPDLLKKVGFAVRPFASAHAFLTSDCVNETKSLILDALAIPIFGCALVPGAHLGVHPRQKTRKKKRTRVAASPCLDRK